MPHEDAVALSCLTAPLESSLFNLEMTYLLEFILAEKGFVEMFSSMGLFTEGIGLLEMPLS